MLIRLKIPKYCTLFLGPLQKRIHLKSAVKCIHTRHWNGIPSRLLSSYYNGHKSIAHCLERCLHTKSDSVNWDLKDVVVCCNEDEWHEQPEGFELNLKYIDTHADKHYSVRKSAKTILALHGTPGTHMDLIPLLKPFAELGYRILIPVMPGLGISRALLPKEELFFTHSSVEKARLLHTFLRVLNVKTIDLAFGHCTGTCTLSLLLATEDHSVKSALYLCPIPPQTPPRAFQPIASLQRVVRLFEKSKFLRPFLYLYMKRICNKSDIQVSQKYMYHVFLTAVGIGYKYLPGLAMLIERKKTFPLSYIYSVNDIMVEENLSNEYADLLGIRTNDIYDETSEYVENKSYSNNNNLKHGIALKTSSHFPQRDDHHRELIISEMKYLLHLTNL